MTSWLNKWRTDWLTDWLAIAVSTRLICKWLEGRAGIEIELEKCTADRRHRNDNDKALTITQKPAKPAAAAEENKMPRLRDSDDSLLSIWSRHYVAKGRHHSPRVPRLPREPGGSRGAKTSARCVVWATHLCEIDDDWKLHRLERQGIIGHDSVMLTTFADKRYIYI